METNRIICGDSAKVLQGFEDECIDLTVTSPPYDNLRIYNGFVFDFEAIARQLYRVTKVGGVVVWVVGDATVNGSETLTSFKQALFFRECGFNVETMIWQKDTFSNPTNNQYHSVFEYMFIMSKGSYKTFNPIADRKNLMAGTKQHGASRDKSGNLKQNKGGSTIPGYGKRFNVWYIPVHKATGDYHPAVFPEALARDHILSWSNEGDIVLDCFAGSGTTLKMAKQLGRQYIGIDISEEYCRLAEKRVLAANVPLFTLPNTPVPLEDGGTKGNE